MNTLFKAALSLSFTALSSLAHATEEPKSAVPLQVSLCMLLRDPAAYDHKLVRVSGDVSRGFEDFTLSDRSCPKGSSRTVWLELGGRVGSGVVYCCNAADETRRAEPLAVEGVATSMVEDATFKRFQRLTRASVVGYGQAHVTLVGVYFAGQKQVSPGGTFWGGYGHMGMFSLLVVQQVVTAERKTDSDT